MFALSDNADAIKISLKENISSPPLQQLTRTARDIIDQPLQQLCFNKVNVQPNTKYVISFESTKPSRINLYYYGTPNNKSAYFVRVEDPTSDELSRSEKNAKLDLAQNVTSTIDSDAAVLSRHIQVTANASSARWISAVGLKHYLKFAQKSLSSNADELTSGDGVHFLESGRAALNRAGVTHIIQSFPDTASDLIPDLNFPLLSEFTDGHTIHRLYLNPEVFPKAFLDPPVPDANIEILAYADKLVEVKVITPTQAQLVVSDSTTPQWQTFLDGQYISNDSGDSLFKTASVPPGEHVISFRYHSPAVSLASKLAGISLLISAVILLLPFKFKRRA